MAGRPRTRSSIPDRGKISFPKRPHRLWTPRNFYSVSVWCLSLRSGSRRVKVITPSGFLVKNEWVCTSAPTLFHGVHGDCLTFSFYFCDRWTNHIVIHTVFPWFDTFSLRSVMWCWFGFSLFLTAVIYYQVYLLKTNNGEIILIGPETSHRLLSLHYQ
jgi:hypothetical protein